MIKNYNKSNKKTNNIISITKLSNSYVDTKKYEGTKEYTGSNSYYPAIFAKEKTAWVNEIQGTELDLSQQNEPIQQTTNMPANPTDESKIKMTQTSWSKTMKSTDWKNSIYQNIFIKNNSGSNYSDYWISSRCVYANETLSLFAGRMMKNGLITCGWLFKSSGDVNYQMPKLRPVVTLNSDVKLTSSDENIWQLN